MRQLSPTTGSAKAAAGGAFVPVSLASSSAFGDRIQAMLPGLFSTALVFVMVCWAYWPNLQALWIIWARQPNYSHGFLVIPVALWIFWEWMRGVGPRWSTTRGPWWSWLSLVAILGVRALAYEWSNQWVENATIIPVVACLMFILGGWPLLAVGWPAAFFLIFMLPLPPVLNDLLALPLQRLATLGSAFTLQLLGFLALPEGNILYLPDAPDGSRVLEVAQACNGLSMLMTLAATVTATLFLINLSNWKRVVVLASALPIALLSNIVRIVSTGLCYHFIKDHEALKWTHDVAGWLMMPLALVLVLVELVILDWLAAGSGSDTGRERLADAVIPQDAVATRRSRAVQDRPVLAIIPEQKGPKGKAKSDKDTFPVDD